MPAKKKILENPEKSATFIVLFFIFLLFSVGVLLLFNDITTGGFVLLLAGCVMTASECRQSWIQRGVLFEFVEAIHARNSKQPRKMSEVCDIPEGICPGDQLFLGLLTIGAVCIFGIAALAPGATGIRFTAGAVISAVLILYVITVVIRKSTLWYLMMVTWGAQILEALSWVMKRTESAFETTVLISYSVGAVGILMTFYSFAFTVFGIILIVLGWGYLLIRFCCFIGKQGLNGRGYGAENEYVERYPHS